MRLSNIDVREMIEKKRLRQYEIASALGVSESTFSTWMRTELSPERRKAIISAIKKL